MSSLLPSVRRVGGTALAAGTALALVAVPAAAHVTVSSPDAAAGGYGKVVLRVPNESDTAATNRLTIAFPDDVALAHVTVQPKPGWEVEVEEGALPEPVDVGGTEVTEAVRTITWTTDGAGIAPGEFDEFAISGGPFPDAESVVLAADQGYDDGEVVAWDEVAEGEEEPERPAPVLTLLAADEGGHGAHGAAAGDDVEATSASTQADGGSDVLSRVLAGAALVVALGALLVSVRENRRRDRS